MSSLLSEQLDEAFDKEKHELKRLIIIEYVTGVVMFDHIFPKAWTTKEDIDIGGFLLSCCQLSKTLGGGTISKYVLHPPKKEPLSVESPFSINVTKQLESESTLIRSSSGEFSANGSKITAGRLSTAMNANVLNESLENGTMSTRIKNINGGSVRRHNPTKSGLTDLLKKSEGTSSISLSQEHFRMTYIVFGKINKECCVACVFLEGDDNWTELAQTFADQITCKFEELYESSIQSLKKDFETIKSEAEIDQKLIDKVRNTFQGFTKDMQNIKDKVLAEDPNETIRQMSADVYAE